MGWDGAGGYTRQHNFSADASAGIKILAARMDQEIDDIASAIPLAWARNGQNVPTVDMPMGGRKFVNVGAPTSVSNFMRVREFIENVPIFMQDAETSADRISVSSQYFTSVSANQAPVDGTKIMVRVKSNKSSAVMYLDGHSANVEYQDGTRIGPALVSGGIYEFTYSSADAAWRVASPDDGRTAAEIAAGVTPTNYQYTELDVRRYGYLGQGTPSNAADVAAVNAALSVCSAGATVDVLVTAAGFALGENSITVPEGVRLRFRGNAGLPLGKFATNGSLNSSSLPGMGMVVVTSTSLPAIILRSNATVEGAMFWCPNQNWDITSLAESFNTYTAIQLGDATEPGPYHPNVIGCQFIGPTTLVKQYATDGSSVKGGAFEHLTGVLMGEGFRIARSTDVLHFASCHFTPNAVTNYVGDVSIGGDVDVFRAKCAQAAKVFHFGKVDDFRAVDVFAFGVLNYAHWNTGFFTGDDNAGLGGTIIGGAADSCYQAFVVERSVSTIPLNIVGGWFAPNFRPNGAAGDSSSQAFMIFAAGLTDLRISVLGVAINGGAVGEFPANYSGQRDNDFVAAGALSTGNNILVTEFHTRNQNTGIVGSGLTDIVTLGPHTLADVAQRPIYQVGVETRGAGYYQDGTLLIDKNSGNGATRVAQGGGDIQWGNALVALGGGSAPTLGTIGGSGPATATQNSWMRVVDSTGAAFWVPVWK